MIVDWEALRRRNRFSLALDLLMLVLALANVLAIAFDTSYLYLRPYYRRYTPAVAAYYDPVKGIEPHQFTESYLAASRRFLASFERFPDGDPALRQELIEMSRQMLRDDPFQLARKSGDLELIKNRMRRETGVSGSSVEALEAFWRMDRSNHARREIFFHRNIEPLLAANYWRRIDVSGRYVDYFVYVNIGFIAIFMVEFLIQWEIAVRTMGDAQRILFPLTRWYDLLSFIPLQELAFLRLFRFVSIYFRVVQSDVVRLNQVPVVRGLYQLADIVLEEISDQVSLRILSDIQEKVKLGVTDTLMEGTLVPHKQAIRQVFLYNLVKFQERALIDRRDEWVQMVAVILQDAIKQSDYYKGLSRIPLMGRQVERLAGDEPMRHAAAQIVDNLGRATSQTLQSPEGSAFLATLVDDLLDEFILVFREPLLRELIKNMNLQMIEELKKSTRVKRWKATLGMQYE